MQINLKPAFDDHDFDFNHDTLHVSMGLYMSVLPKPRFGDFGINQFARRVGKSEATAWHQRQLELQRQHR